MLPLLLTAFMLFTGMNGTASFAAKKKVKVSIRLKQKHIVLSTQDKTYLLKATVKPKKAKVSWKSSKSTVASVTSKGMVKIKKAGSTTITATAHYQKQKKKASCKITVKKPSIRFLPSNILVSQIVTNQDAYTIEIGKSLSLGTSVLPSNASDKNVKYISDNPAVAVVDSKGMIQPLKEGITRITIEAADRSKIRKVVSVTVISPIFQISLKEDAITLNVGESYVLAPEIAPETATLYSCTLSNSKDYIASVSADGKIIAKYPGISILTVSAKNNPGVSYKLRINVTDDFAPPEGFDQYDETIEHGTLKGLNYVSDYRSSGRAHALVWLPPDYDEEKQYNLLFCLHGGNDNEYYWTGDKGGANDGCSADKVLDNAYAKGLIEDTIVVFTSGVINYEADKDYPNVVENPLLTDFWKNHFLLEFEILNNLLPYMQQEYPVMTGPEHTGICGLSMGCAQTMEIGLKHPEQFGYIGCYSAGPFAKDAQTFVTNTEDADRLNTKLKLLFFITGENDHMMEDSMRNFVKACDGFGLNHVFYEVPGRGHDDFCWDRCLYAFMKYAFK